MPAFTVGFLPWWPQNPYQVLLKRELNTRNVRVIGNPPLNPLRILIKRDGLDIVHIHWPHGLYARKPWRFPLVILVFLLYRMLKNNLVWTVHELEFHEPNIPFLDNITRSLLMKISRSLIVHGEDTAKKVRERFGYTRSIRVVHHPSYQGWYPDTVSREYAREWLKLSSDKKIYLFFGYLKPYKGVEDLIAAFRKVKDDDAVLVIAGKPVDDLMKNRINELAALDVRIKTYLKYIPDEEVQYFLKAADIFVFPSRDTQTSGSIMLALTFGLPIIAPAVGTIPEHVTPETAVLFDPEQPDAILDALRICQMRDLNRMRQAALLQRIDDDWKCMGGVHTDAYQEALIN